MSKLVPEDLNEVKSKLNQLKRAGKEVDPDRFMDRVTLQLFQIYLDNAEEGHYDTAKLIDPRTIAVDNVGDQAIGKISSRGPSFADDFKRNSLFLRIRLEELANRIAIQDS